jgi:hypothetical protein
MTKRLTAVLVCLAAAPALAGVAHASAVSYSNALKLAKQLARLQTRDRNVISFHVLKGKRAPSGAIVFPYDDRTADNVYCTAQIVVTEKAKAGGGFTRFAQFRNQRCKGIPAAALAFESITRSAQRALRASALATADAIDNFRASIRPCARLHVPRGRLTDANELLAIGLTEAIETPNDTPLGDFVAALQRVNTTNHAVLGNGATAWLDYLSVVRALPNVPDACGSLQRWAQNGWTASTAPIDFSAAIALDGRAAIDAKAIGRAAAELARDGVFRSTAAAFTPKGLLLGPAPSVAVVRG